MMDDDDAQRMLAALSHATRTRTLRTLARNGPDGVASGDLAEAVGVPRNLMSSHLAVLSRAGVVEARKSGRSILYSAVGGRIEELGAHLRELGRTASERQLTGSVPETES